MSAPAIIIYSLDHATAAIKAAAVRNTPLTLLSAPGAAASLGASVFKSLIDQARHRFPEVSLVAALDCGSDGGHALAAIREGIETIVFDPDCPAFVRVLDIAQQSNVTILPPAVYGSAILDLQEFAEPLAACHDFLHTIEKST